MLNFETPLVYHFQDFFFIIRHNSSRQSYIWLFFCIFFRRQKKCLFGPIWYDMEREKADVISDLFKFVAIWRLLCPPIHTTWHLFNSMESTRDAWTGVWWTARPCESIPNVFQYITKRDLRWSLAWWMGTQHKYLIWFIYLLLNVTSYTGVQGDNIDGAPMNGPDYQSSSIHSVVPLCAHILGMDWKSSMRAPHFDCRVIQ